jgi:adenylate kinase family enzyme
MMQKIMVIGSSGAGKSTLARQLGEILNIPVIHLDTFYWRPGWVRPSQDEWRQQQAQLLQGDSWIVDGEYINSLDIRIVAADTIILLEFPRMLCLYRSLKRYLQFFGKARIDRAEGCSERIDAGHLWWIVWQYPTSGRHRAMQKIQEMNAAHKLIVLRSPREVKRFVRALQSRTEAASA